jgi:hypothetical protein
LIDLLTLLQQNPIVVDLTKQPPPTQDVSIDFVLNMFLMAGVFLVAAALGSVLVAVVILLYKRWRDSSATETGTSHTTLRI